MSANRGKRVIALTHKPVLPDTPVAARNRSIIAAVNAAGFTINLSANNPAQADAQADLQIAPVVTHGYARRTVRRRAKRRPDEWAETIAEWRDRIAASAAAHAGGTAHRDLPGSLSPSRTRHLARKATAARDVPVGDSWAFQSSGRARAHRREKTAQPDAFSPLIRVGRRA